MTRVSPHRASRFIIAARLFTTCVALSTMTGCLGDAEHDPRDPDGSQSDVGASGLALAAHVEGARWRGAPAGCEDVSGEGLVLAACEGEPGLGALLDRSGGVRCVDALALLAPSRSTIAAGDPSPQPNRPPPPEGATAQTSF